MKKTAIFYSFNAVKTSQIAQKIQKEFTNIAIDLIDTETMDFNTLMQYDNLILGVPTWFDGELPLYWDEIVPAMETMDFKGKYVAIFGNGDQKGYADNFADAIGIMATIVEERGATLAGMISTEGYDFESSRAVRDRKFLGLVLDFENQPRKNNSRVKAWVEQLKKELA